MRLLLTSLALCVVSGGLVLAEEGRIPIFEPVVLDGTSGDISGKYVVTRNISLTADAPVIQVIGTGTERVEIDLNGFTLVGQRAGGDLAGVIEVNGVASIKLRNGSVRNWLTTAANGILVQSSIEVVVEDVVVADPHVGIFIQDAQLYAVRRCFVNRSLGQGIFARDSGLGVIEDNQITNASGTSIVVRVGTGGPAGGCQAVTIARNKVFSGNDGIVSLDCTGVVIEHNTVLGSTNQGIRVEGSPGCLVLNNSVSDCGGNGIRLLSDSPGCRVAGNVSERNVLHGILVGGSGTHVEGNVVRSNETGIGVNADNNMIIKNNMSANTLRGLYFNVGADNNTFGDNSANGNTGAPTCNSPPGACAAPDFCDASAGMANTSFGTNLMPGGC